MYKIMIPLVLAALTTLLLAVPITDNQNPQNDLVPSIESQNNNNMNNAGMSPIHLRDSRGLDCSKPGFFINPTNCSHFYQCVDIIRTGHFSVLNFECNPGQVFYQNLLSCFPGSCSHEGFSSPGHGLSPPPSPVLMNPSMGMMNPALGKNPALGLNPALGKDPATGMNPALGKDPSMAMNPALLMNPPVNSHPVTFPPSPPPQSPSTPVTQQVMIPQWFNELPTWFKEKPWWFNTAPSWLNQPPAWLNAKPSAHVISEEIYINESEPNGPHVEVVTGTKPGKITKHITTHGNVSIGGMDNTFLHDNKTIRIHIPIHIVQQ